MAISEKTDIRGFSSYKQVFFSFWRLQILMTNLNVTKYYDQVCRLGARLKVPLKIYSSKYHCLRYFNFSLVLWLHRHWSHIRVYVYQIFYQTKTTTLTIVVPKTITRAAVTWIIKNLTNTNKATIKQYRKTYTLFMQELAERKNTFDLIFLYYLHSAYNRGFFYSFAK